jgi:hypothetical protein
MLTNWLDGFGVFASILQHQQLAEPATPRVWPPTASTPAASRCRACPSASANIAVYFEKWGFSARVAARSRSDFVGEVADGVGDRKLTYIKGETITDAQVGYEIQSGFAKGLAFRFEISNVNNTPFIRYRDSVTNEVENKKDGKFYQFGINYKL